VEALVDCSACGTGNDAGRRFCLECGAPLARACPACGAANPPAGKFCGNCGSPLRAVPADTAAADAAPGPAVPTTERRLVSVLFLDLVSFTTLSEQRDAEEVRELLDDYFRTARTVIERHGGVVEKFIGDAVMAVWGTPVTHEDDGERAVRAGLELVDAVDALGAATHAPLRARCGVHTGEAATGQGADHQGMVTGDTVNTAARLQSAAEPGQVLVGEATYRMASVSIAFEPAGPMTLKGKEQPVPAWRALRVVAERQGQNRMPVEPPFVGRAEELRILKELLHATGREGKPRVVSVTGIGGIGKSRLSWELRKYVDGLQETVWWHQGRCPSYGDGITFWALGEMVRMRAGIAETDAAGVSRTKLAASVAQHVPDEDERRWLEPRLAFLLGLEDRPTGGAEELFAAWRTFFERISDGGTVVLVFEDLQWADAGLLDFIEALLEWSRDRPILVVTLARPELADRRPTWGAGTRSFLALHLEPLPDDRMTELVRGLVPDADPTAVGRIVERAEGIPLYAVEMIRMLADKGVLRAGDDAYELVGDLGELEVPGTLHALVASRLDALPADDRALLQNAAILGKCFTLDALAAVDGAATDVLEHRLLGLVRREFVVREVDPRSPERGQFAFVQGIIREIAYGMLSRADRRARHLAVAHHLEAAGDDELASAVAAHYVEALDATAPGPDRDALGARARDWLAQAAHRATGLGSPLQALALSEQALAITPAGEERAAILKGAARAAGDALQRDQELAYLREAAALLGDLGDVAAELAALGVLGTALGDVDMVDELRAVTDRMGSMIDRTDDPLAHAEYQHASGFLRYFEGDVEGSLAAIDRAAAGYEKAGAVDRFRKAMLSRAVALESLGRAREELTLRRGILAIALEENDLRTAATVLIGLSTSAGEWPEAFRLGMEAAAVARRGGCAGPELRALANAVEYAIEVGEWAAADELLADLGSRSGPPQDLVDAVALDEALLAAYRGEHDRSRMILDQVDERLATSPNTTYVAWYRRVRSVLLLTSGDHVGAFDEAIRAIDAEAVTGPNTLVAAAYAGHAALWSRDRARAREALRRMPVLEGGWPVAVRRALEAGVDALEGRVREAASAYDSVLAGRLAAGDPFTRAVLAVGALAVLPAELVPEGTAETTRSYLEGLGAHGLLAHLPVVAAAGPV
jgi:class 3 adenylate cyclase/tetratricopeptide (TPR) repeat protein